MLCPAVTSLGISWLSFWSAGAWVRLGSGRQLGCLRSEVGWSCLAVMPSAGLGGRPGQPHSANQQEHCGSVISRFSPAPSLSVPCPAHPESLPLRSLTCHIASARGTSAVSPPVSRLPLLGLPIHQDLKVGAVPVGGLSGGQAPAQVQDSGGRR